MANIKFEYRYRDGGNYKNYKEIVFANPNNVDLEELEELIRSKLIDETFFYVKEWLLPKMYFATFDYDDDPTWHEFISVSYTDESANFSVSLHDWIARIKLVG